MSFTIKAFQGIGVVATAQVRNTDGTPVLNKYVGNEILSGYVWPGDNQPITFTFAPVWNSGPLGLIDIPIPGGSTANVIPGFYEVIVKLADDSQALVYGYLEIDSSPNLVSTDLVTIPYVRAALAEINLTETQVDFLPYAIESSSQIIKRFCGDRDFIRTTYTTEYIPNYNGEVRLDQIPVNQIVRVQGNRTPAITIQQNDTNVATAWINWSFTGDYTSGITITGLNLFSEMNGISIAQNILFSSLSPPTVASLVSAISSLSAPSWNVQDNGYSTWPITELLGGDVAQGAIIGRGATLDVYSQDYTNCILHSPIDGILYIGYQNTSTGFGPKWGPDWLAFDFPGLPPGNVGKVKITYDAGFSVIPSDIQQATAELAKYLLQRLKLDMTLERERLGDYEYWLRKLWPGMPDSVKHVISLYRLTNA